MKPSTLTAKLCLDRATRELNEALENLEASQDGVGGWLAHRSIEKSEAAKDALEIALGHVRELAESEIAYTPDPDFKRPESDVK